MLWRNPSSVFPRATFSRVAARCAGQHRRVERRAFGMHLTTVLSPSSTRYSCIFVEPSAHLLNLPWARCSSASRGAALSRPHAITGRRCVRPLLACVHDCSICRCFIDSPAGPVVSEWDAQGVDAVVEVGHSHAVMRHIASKYQDAARAKSSDFPSFGCHRPYAQPRAVGQRYQDCLLYTSPSPRDLH